MANQRKALGTALEERVAKKARERNIPAKRQPGSGTFKGFPNDVYVGDLLVECKVRDVDKSFRIELEWFDKVREHAQQAGYRDGVVVVNKKGGRKPMVVCDLDFFLDLLQGSTLP